MDAIYKSIRELHQTLQPEDRLLIYFAGHGDYDGSLVDDISIVCSDSKSIEEDPMRNSYIQATKLKKMINKIPARQVLLVIDICHGGIFDEDVFGSKSRDNIATTNLGKNVAQFINEKVQFKTRRMLSSVGKESAFDGKEGKHSPFAYLLLSVLRGKGEGTNGIVTLSDIYAVLQSSSLNETATLKISPHKAGFGDDDVSGEFVFMPKE